MKTNGISGGYVYSNFDEVDIEIMIDKSLDKALDDLEMDAQMSKDPMGNDMLQEVINMSDAINNFDEDIEVPKEVVNTVPDQIEMQADEYINAYNDLHGVIDTGEMIDIISGTK